MSTSAHLLWFICFVSFCQTTLTVGEEGPKSADGRLVVEKFAGEPDIVHPVGAAFDKRGRLLVVESHTHFRPEKYTGPKHDRIRILEDTDGDGKADRFTIFYEGLHATMGIAAHPDGSIYVATRNEVLRLRDPNGTGKASERTRLAFLETKADYPHNGLSGLAFDADGNVYFGMGENQGHDYKLIGADGTTLEGGGEGGNIYWCTADGKNLRRVATGFWNPFGICVYRGGYIFSVDNDPDTSPPCRMLHVIEGGDYGYQYRYGRSGRHPFQSWNGELPGTLPQMAGTGEAPCQILAYEGCGLPEEYRGDLLVAAWADHRIERYRIKRRGLSFSAERLPFISSAGEFRPVGIAVAPDGSLYITDWVLRDYHLHGRGAVWHVRWKDGRSKSTANTADSNPSHAAVASLAADQRAIERRSPIELLSHSDPFVRAEVVRKLAKSNELVELAKTGLKGEALIRVGVLLALRESGTKAALDVVPGLLGDPDRDVQFLAVKWISDEKLSSFRPQLAKMMANPKLDVGMCLATATALARIDGREAKESDMADYFFNRLVDSQARAGDKAMALRLLPANFAKLNLKLLMGLLNASDLDLQLEVVRIANETGKSRLSPAILAAALETDMPETIRAEAVVGWASWCKSPADLLALMDDGSKAVRAEVLRGLTGAALTDEQRSKLEKIGKKRGDGGELLARAVGKSFHSLRPVATNLDGWEKLLDGPSDEAAGRRIFSNPKLTGCTNCHRMDGRGQNVGPDLSTIGRVERRAILESLLLPSKSVAPSYQPWQVATIDGKLRTGLLVHTAYDECTYVDANGERFTVATKDVEQSKPSVKSIMPDGLLDRLTDQEIRDLLAYLKSRK